VAKGNIWIGLIAGAIEDVIGHRLSPPLLGKDQEVYKVKTFGTTQHSMTSQMYKY
jgi:hypothetical protein